MSQLLINSVSLISRLCGCLVYFSSTKISLLSCFLYPVNVIQTLQITILFLYNMAFDQQLLPLDFKKYSIVLRMLGLDSNAILVIKYVIAFTCQLVTLIGSWRHRNLVGKCMTEANVILKTHQRSSDLSLNDWYQIFIYPTLVILRFALISSTDFFEGSDGFSIIFGQCFIMWAQMASICTEGQFAALASIVEKALIDINHRIEDLAEEVADDYRSNCHLGDNYLHPFFQYQEIMPSHRINIRSILINFQLNKRNPNQGTTRAAYEQYSDSMGGLHFQLLPLREEIRNRRDARAFVPFQDLRTPGASGASGAPGVSGALEAFKAIEEEKQPARNQFATESKPAPLHLLNLRRLRLAGKISPPKTEIRDMKSTRITVRSKNRNPHLGKVEGSWKRREMRELTKQHSRVARLAADLSTSFESQLAATQLFVKLNCPLNLYLLLRFFWSTSGTDKTCCSDAWKIAFLIAHQLFRIFNVCKRGQCAIIQDEKTNRNLLALSRARLCPRLVHEVLTSVFTSLIILTQFSG